MGLEAINQSILISLEKAVELRKQLQSLSPTNVAEFDLRLLRFIGTRKHCQPLSLSSLLIWGYFGFSRVVFPSLFS